METQYHIKSSSSTNSPGSGCPDQVLCRDLPNLGMPSKILQVPAISETIAASDMDFQMVPVLPVPDGVGRFMSPVPSKGSKAR
jgi:hypothetical protein